MHSECRSYPSKLLRFWNSWGSFNRGLGTGKVGPALQDFQGSEIIAVFLTVV